MKRRTFIKSGITGAAGIAMGPVAVAGQGAGQGRRAEVRVPRSNEKELAMLVYMREEEKLARDVYRVMFDRWGARVFGNISKSEERHMAAIAGRLSYHQVPDPVVEDATGIFSNTQLANSYIELTEWGMSSEEDAFMVGAYIEERDILDLQKSIVVSGQADLIAVYGQLMRGSRNHLRAFVRHLENLGYVYQAQLLEQSEVDSIVDSPLERGRLA